MDYYVCKCCPFNDEFELCAECSKWMDSVETTIENIYMSLNQWFHVKRWLGRKNKHKQN